MLPGGKVIASLIYAKADTERSVAGKLFPSVPKMGNVRDEKASKYIFAGDS